MESGKRVRRWGGDRVGRLRVLSLLLALVVGVAPVVGQPVEKRPRGNAEPGKPAVSINDPKAFPGYTLVAPMNSMKTYLVDMAGRVARTWESDCTPALTAYLLEDGHLLRPGNLGPASPFFGPGAGGRVQEFDWDGKLVWDFRYANEKQLPHHDITRLPNGSILMIVWDRKTQEEAIAAGRRVDTIREGHILSDAIIEVKPTGPTSGEVVWEWHAWDHLIQDHDRTKGNFGNVSRHPERIDINFGEGMIGQMMARPGGLDQLRGLGYIGGPPGGGPGGPGGGPAPDWTHINSVAYNPDLDQIVLSVHAFSEIWIIDHSTTTSEAASSKGGRSGKGGDLLYRWGNPRAYRSGTNADRRLFHQHNAHWIAKGLPGEGHLLIFNNGGGRPDGTYSSVDELVLPMDEKGHYTRKAGLAFGPDRAAWSYTAPKKPDFYSMLISGAQRLANGNTLICSGNNATVFEVTPEEEVVWKLVAPLRGLGGPGFMPFAPPRPGEVLPTFLQDALRLTPEQRQELSKLQKEVDGKLDGLLTAEQKKQLKEMTEAFTRGPRFGPPVAGGPGGQRDRGGPNAGPGPVPGGPGGPFAGPPGGPGGPGGLFRSYRYGADYPGLKGKTLKPGKKLEELPNL